MTDVLTSISRRRGSALVLVNPTCTSQTDSRAGLLQGTRQGGQFYCVDEVVLDADANAVCCSATAFMTTESRCELPGTNQDSGGGCSTWTQVAGVCSTASIDRERVAKGKV